MKNKVRRNLKKNNEFDFRKKWRKYSSNRFWYPPTNIQIKNGDKWEPLCAINIE